MKFSNLLSQAAQLFPRAGLIGAAALAFAFGIAAQRNSVHAQTRPEVVIAGYSAPQITIRSDMGGDVGARANKIRAMRASGQAVAIRGPSCYSACTMYLSLPGSCISRKARFGFHRPSYYGAALSPERFEFWSRVIASHYPAPLQSWYMAEGRHSISLRMFSGADLIRMGVSECS